ncbi:phytanoyl-CoA dioxygenase family protein [Alienimonas sp. DA493]|uniref:phytanoyl-CoA dioxygenase family protein n=1 Tax=Alienimonas sp. DA493 TaxID=3373605 RepID=UPI003754EEC5
MATKSAFSAFKPGGVWHRAVSTQVMRGLRAADSLGVPHSLTPSKKLKGIRKYWNREMMDRYIASRGTELPHDEMCQLRVPDPLVPKTDDVAPENKLSTEDLAAFYRNGYLKPFKAFEPEEIKDFGRRLLERCDQPSQVYPGGDPHRDRHLEMPEMMRLIAHPAITDRLAQLLGPNLITWRSQLFHKPPGNNPVGWHQATTYMFEEEFGEPSVFPPDINELFMLTVWIPADPSTRKNGCLKVDTSSVTERTRWMRLGGDVGFHAVNYGPCYEVKEEDVHYVEMEPGEVLIFTERAIHGSDANKSDHNRMAFNFRVVPTDVQVYRPGKRFHKASQMNRVYDLTNWRPVVIRGTDTVRKNETVPWTDYAGSEPVPGKITPDGAPPNPSAATEAPEAAPVPAGA